MATLWQDVKYGIRVLRTSPGFTAVTILTLALGIGINAAIFSVLHAVLLRPLPYEDPDRVVRIDETSGRGGIGVSPPNFRDFQKQNRSFEQVGAYTGNNFVLTGTAEPMRVEGLKVSHNLFSLLGVRPLLGRSFLPEEEWPGQDHVAIVAHSLWQRRFNGDAGLVGRNILLDSRSYLVVGVMPLEFEFPIQAERIEIWTPLSLPADAANLRGAHYLDVIGRLKKNVSLVQAHADLEMIADRLARQFPKFVPGKMIVVRLKQDLVGNVETSLMILAGAMILVLLIATANVASLFLARAAKRRREVAVRMALGASRARLVRQLLTESFLLSLLGGMAGILFALWGTEILVAIGPADVPRLRTAQVDGWVLLFAVIASLGTGVMVGVAPALPASMSGLHADLKEAGTRGTTAPRQPLRKMLVLSEVTLALVLLCGAGLLIKTLSKLNSVHPGFDPKDALVAEVVLPESKYRDGEQQAAFFGRLLELIKALPGVDSAGATTNLPLSGTNMVFMVSIEGRPDSASKASFRAISPDYFRAMRIPLLKGRWFEDRDTESSLAVAVVSETMAQRFWPGEDPLGKRVAHGFKNQVAEVVGVVGDVKYAGLDRAREPEMYVPFRQSRWPFMRLVVRAKSDPMKLAGAVQAQVQLIDRDQPLDKIRELEAVVDLSIATRRFYMRLLGTFAALALVLAFLGIYGVVSYSVTQRTQEIGIRMALGAERCDVLRLILSEGFGLSLIGVILGLLGALGSTRVLSALLFDVTPTDLTTFVAYSLLLMGAALVASYIPARRATRVDPLAALRHE